MQLRMKVCSCSKLSVPCIFGQPRSIVPVTTLYVRVSHANSVLYPVTALNVQLCKCACVPLQPHNVVPVTTLYLYVCHVTTPYYCPRDNTPNVLVSHDNPVLLSP